MPNDLSKSIIYKNRSLSISTSWSIYSINDWKTNSFIILWFLYKHLSMRFSAWLNTIFRKTWFQSNYWYTLHVYCHEFMDHYKTLIWNKYYKEFVINSNAVSVWCIQISSDSHNSLVWTMNHDIIDDIIIPLSQSGCHVKQRFRFPLIYCSDYHIYQFPLSLYHMFCRFQM